MSIIDTLTFQWSGSSSYGSGWLTRHAAAIEPRSLGAYAAIPAGLEALGFETYRNRLILVRQTLELPGKPSAARYEIGGRLSFQRRDVIYVLVPARPAQNQDPIAGLLHDALNGSQPSDPDLLRLAGDPDALCRATRLYPVFAAHDSAALPMGRGQTKAARALADAIRADLADVPWPVPEIRVSVETRGGRYGRMAKIATRRFPGTNGET